MIPPDFPHLLWAGLLIAAAFILIIAAMAGVGWVIAAVFVGNVEGDEPHPVAAAMSWARARRAAVLGLLRTVRGAHKLGRRIAEAATVDDDITEDGEQCPHCLRYTYEPGYGCSHCRRGLPSDEVERYDDDYVHPLDEEEGDELPAEARQRSAAEESSPDAVRPADREADDAPAVRTAREVRHVEQRAVGLQDVQAVPAGVREAHDDLTEEPGDEWGDQLHALNADHPVPAHEPAVTHLGACCADGTHDNWPTIGCECACHEDPPGPDSTSLPGETAPLDVDTTNGTGPGDTTALAAVDAWIEAHRQQTVVDPVFGEWLQNLLTVDGETNATFMLRMADALRTA